MLTSVEANGRTVGGWIKPVLSAALAVLVIAAGGCSKAPDADDEAKAPTPSPASGVADTEYVDFKDGPDEAPVKVVAFYPGRHEDTLAAVKSLLETFEGRVQVEIVDWRHKQGLQRQSDAGLTCAAVTVNGESAFDLETDGEPTKVLFERGMGGEWTKAELEAAVRQELEASGEK
ncbi:MAG: hypothetical protein QGH74_05135 [Candidatus Brocadiia bacterium]|jgi:hypothetical protein|nr:hypothetical protein [Candidatus Brocadiia bacterium]